MITLEASYARCRTLNKRYGTTYYWSTYALPREKRHHVHALYAFCRYADDIVDEHGRDPTVESTDRARCHSGSSRTVIEPTTVTSPSASFGGMPSDVRAKALRDFGDRFFDDLAAGSSEDDVLKAVVHTVKAFDIDVDCFRRFLRSMEMDLSIARYETFDELMDYTDGSAAVIGEMMLPILEPLSPDALAPARALGDAFQLTNFLRDIDEDLDRGRTYVPQEEIRRFGAEAAFAERRVTPGFVALMQFEIERARKLYRSATAGFDLLPPASARCVRAAHQLYGRILSVIEAHGYDVFSQRARVPTWQKAVVVGRVLQPGRR